MKKFTKIVAVLLAGAMVAGLLGGCQSKNSIDRIKSSGELVMLTNAAFPPFEYIENNKEVGVDVDISTEIAKELGVKLKVTNMDFDAIIDYIKAGKGDIAAAGITINEERKGAVDFSKEYVTSKQFVIIPKDIDPKTFDLNGKKIGVQQGTTGDLYYASVTDHFKAGDVKRYKNSIDAVAEMKNNRVDCVIIDELPAKKLVEQNPQYICYDPGYAPESYAIAFKKGDKELAAVVNKVLDRMIKDGKITQLVIDHSSK